ncbi:MAG: PD-(D/E)XK nuclease family protein, partial [Victivallales bacterium]|nr:PD-(D/E)XK nuclease family protein [Victivallales bacterium]
MEEESKPTLAQLKEQPHYSYTALNTYINTCQLLYYYRYVEKAEVERTPVALPFGSAFHCVLSEQAQAAKTGKLLTAEQMTDAFATYFQANCKDAANIVFKRDENIEDQIATAKRMFEVMNKEWIDYWNIQSVAEPFKVEIPGLSKPLIGELDMVISEQTPFDDENGKGSDTIVDFKTAARMWSDDRAEKDLQATVFSYAFEKVHQRRPTSFRFDVVTKAKTPTVRHFFTSRDDNHYQRLEKLFTTADRGIQAGVFLPNESSFACSDCPYADRCSGWHCKENTTVST